MVRHNKLVKCRTCPNTFAVLDGDMHTFKQCRDCKRRKRELANAQLKNGGKPCSGV